MRNRESALEISEDPQSKLFKIAERSAFYPPTIYIYKWIEIIYMSVDDVGNFSVGESGFRELLNKHYCIQKELHWKSGWYNEGEETTRIRLFGVRSYNLIPDAPSCSPPLKWPIRTTEMWFSHWHSVWGNHLLFSKLKLGFSYCHILPNTWGKKVKGCCQMYLS